MEQGKREPERTPRTHQKRQSTGGHSRVPFILGTCGLIFVTTCIMFFCIFMIYVKTTLSAEVNISAEDYAMKLSSVVYYEDDAGQWQPLQTLVGDEIRIWMDYDRMPEALTEAAIAIEDRRFESHNGVDWWRTSQAVVNMFFGMKNTFGGSTITQQLIKNMTKENQNTVKRKVTEIFRALEFEKHYTKQEIMELYLNTICFGHMRYGVETAAQFYFGKSAHDLTTAECASLIGITNNPWAFDPLRTDKSRQNNKNRQEDILAAMKKQGFIEEDEYNSAMAQTLVFADGSAGDGVASDEEKENNTKFNSYFVDQVINDVAADLMAEKGITNEAAIHQIYYGGYQIYTTVDPEIQEIAESVYENRDNLDYKSRKGQMLQSAMTILDPKSGDVVAMVGGIGEKKGNRLLNWATTVRQCGSSIKPIAVYGPALDAGVITMATVTDSSPVRLLNGAPWPKNSGGAYKGLTTLSAAVAGSINTVAVRTIEALGVKNSYKFLEENLGISTLVPDDLNSASLGLGGLTKGVTTEEMAAAFAAFPAEGIYHSPRTYVKVTDGNDNVILEKPSESRVAMKETTAYFVNQLLTGAVNGGTGGGAAISGMTVAGKTGTTSENYDRYFVGYTPYYCAAVWCGYEKNEKISTPNNPSAALFRKVMSKIHEDLPNKKFAVPEEDLVSVSVCKDSGLLASEGCANDVRGESRVQSVMVAKGTEPTEHCTMHSAVEYCTEGKCPAGEFCPKSTIVTKYALDYTREAFGASVSDSPYLLTSLQALPACTVHTEAPPPPEEITPPTEGENPTVPEDGTEPGTGGDWWENPGVDPTVPPEHAA